jgi:hypothetical protein
MADGAILVRVHVLVLCDDVEELADGDDRFDLDGVRTHVTAVSFPYVHAVLCIYLQVTGHTGMASGYVVIVKEATDEEIAHVPIEEFQLLGPLELVSVWLRIRDCEFPEPGVYWFQVFLSDKLVMERRFTVVAATGDSNGRPAR